MIAGRTSAVIASSGRSETQMPKSPLQDKQSITKRVLQTTSTFKSTIPSPSRHVSELSTEDVMRTQRQSESQIPSMSAEPPTREIDRPDESEAAQGPEFGVEQERDVFHQPPNTSSPVLSALPRIRLPKIAGDVQGGDPHVPQKLNADVFYSCKKLSEEDLAHQSDAIDEELLPEGVEHLFHSPRAAKLLNPKAKSGLGSLKHYSSARKFSTSSTRFSEGKRNAQESPRELAADLAEDAKSSSNVSAPSQHSSRCSQG